MFPLSTIYEHYLLLDLLEFQPGSQPSEKEVYAKRPLPPIPASSSAAAAGKQIAVETHQETLDRDVELSTPVTSTTPSSGRYFVH